jgi:putative glutamine amidotransferase
MSTTPIPAQNLTSTFQVNQPYKDSISNAGGSYELIPMNLTLDALDTLLTRLDGILFTGGYDVDPQCYGGQPHNKVEGIDADRDRCELFLVRRAIERGKPFLGICRGIQVINVALGGSLYEDLGEQFSPELQHDNHDQRRNYLAHHVKLEAGSRLDQILGTQNIQVNSLHHQGVRRLAPDVHATGYAPDGLVEAFELPSHPFGLAVQWHPEELQEHESMRRLFQAFVQACKIASSDSPQKEFL